MLVTARPIGFREAVNQPRSFEYPFTVIELHLDKDGACEGTLSFATKVIPDARHNTVVLDDRPQSVPRGPFHWVHTADARTLVWRTNDGFDYFDGVHDGYAPLEHRRRVLALHGDLVVVADCVGGAADKADDAAASAASLKPSSTKSLPTCSQEYVGSGKLWYCLRKSSSLVRSASSECFRSVISRQVPVPRTTEPSAA